MRLVLSWLREFVAIDASAEQIGEKLSIRGFEVASIERLDGGAAVTVLETPANRPACLGVVGLARGVATAFDLPMTAVPKADPLPTGRSDRLTVRLEDEVLCPRFAAAVADVTVAR